MAATDIPFPPSGVTKLYGQNKYYVVIISSSQHGTVQAWLPEKILFQVIAKWGFIVATDDISAGASWVTQLATGAETAKSQYLSAQAWRGSSPMNLTLPLSFFATENSAMEVIMPIKLLIKMSLPRTGRHNFLIPPGPRVKPDLFSVFTGDTPSPGGIDTGNPNTDQINVYIGNFIRMKNVFIDSVVPSFKGRLTAASGNVVEGLPTEGECEVTFRTVYALVAEDIDDIILTGGLQDRPDLKSSTGGSIS